MHVYIYIYENIIGISICMDVYIYIKKIEHKIRAIDKLHVRLWRLIYLKLTLEILGV